jgi:hypothetical protein
MRTMTRGIHIASGETALIHRGPSGTAWAQFDSLTHPHAYNWHLYFRRDFKVPRDTRSTEPRLVL